jgi:hypothetical protein
VADINHSLIVPRFVGHVGHVGPAFAGGDRLAFTTCGLNEMGLMRFAKHLPPRCPQEPAKVRPESPSVPPLAISTPQDASGWHRSYDNRAFGASASPQLSNLATVPSSSQVTPAWDPAQQAAYAAYAAAYDPAYAQQAAYAIGAGAYQPPYDHQAAYAPGPAYAYDPAYAQQAYGGAYAGDPSSQPPANYGWGNATSAASASDALTPVTAAHFVQSQSHRDDR